MIFAEEGLLCGPSCGSTSASLHACLVAELVQSRWFGERDGRSRRSAATVRELPFFRSVKK